MEHIKGMSREQITLFPEAIEDYITEENPVRFIDIFVDKMDVVGLRFSHAELGATGAPPYDPKDLLKLYLYGYLNRIRTSRLLERETQRNIEVMWLIKKLSPDHKTIADFRGDNSEALKGVFREFRVICNELEMFGGELVGVDSTKFKGSNARSKVLDKKGVEKSLKKIEESITEYLKELDENDSKEKDILRNSSILS
jgi:transposase